MKAHLMLGTAITLIFGLASAQAAGWYFEDFEGLSDPLTEWSSKPTDVTPGTPSHQPDRFLGPFVNGSTILTLNDIPAHDLITVSLDLYVIRTWDGNGSSGGEEWDFSIWDQGAGDWQVLQQNGNDLHTGFSNMEDVGNTRQAYPDPYPEGDNPARTGAAENNMLGFEYYDPPRENPITDSVYHIQADPIAHTGSSLQLRFSASWLQAVINPGNNAWDESWGLDNVAVTPEPATLTLLALGGLTVLKRRNNRAV